MMHKVVKDATGKVVAYGPNTEQYVPTVAAGNELSLISEEELAALLTPVLDPPAPNPRVTEIKEELIALDVKRIRPMCEGDTEYLATLNAQAGALREELRGLTGTASETKDATSSSPTEGASTEGASTEPSA